MFELDWGKLVIIGIVALIAIGPKELPTVLRTLGQWVAKIRRMASEFQGQFQEALREAEVADLKKQAEELHSTVTDAAKFDPLAEVDKSLEAEFNAPQPEPASAEAAGQPEAPADRMAALPPIDVPPPVEPAPLTEKDFAPAEPPPAKQAGSGG
jgi:sec-independent protein translocase protein TatB